MTTARTCLTAALLVTACSGPDTPENPTWGDVQPILASNCVRCHGFPATNGAPDSFRLDVYGDEDLPDGRRIRGAATMSALLSMRTNAHRAADYGYTIMPPTVHDDGRHHDIFCRWGGREVEGIIEGIEEPYCPTLLDLDVLPATGDGQPDSTVTLMRPLEDSLVEDTLSIQYEISDPEHDMVRGWLTIGNCVDGRRIGELHSGRDTIMWDIGAEAAVNHRLVACIDDGNGLAEARVWRYQVEHSDGNTAPRPTIRLPAAHALLHETDPATGQISVEIEDPDPGDVLTITVVARREDSPDVVIATDAAASDGLNSLDWNLNVPVPVPEGPGWRLHVTVEDNRGGRRTAISATPFRISRHTTTESYGVVSGDTCGDTDPSDFCWSSNTDLACMFDKCSNCHVIAGSPLRVPGLDHEFGAAPEPFLLRGLMYRRVVELGNMPPPSAGTRFQLCDNERARLEDWLLGGAPQ